MSGWMQHADKCCNDCAKDPDPLDCIIVRAGTNNTGEILGFLTNVTTAGFRYTNKECKPTSGAVVGSLESARYCNPRCLDPEDVLSTTHCYDYGIEPWFDFGGTSYIYTITGTAPGVGALTYLGGTHPAGWSDQVGSSFNNGTYPVCHSPLTTRRALTWTAHPTGTGSYVCTSVDVTFLTQIADGSCDSHTRTLAPDWYVAGATFTVDGENYFLQECNSTYPRTPHDAVPCFRGSTSVQGVTIAHLFTDADQEPIQTFPLAGKGESNSLCGSYGGWNGNVGLHRAVFGWYISADHDTIVVYALIYTGSAQRYNPQTVYAMYTEIPYSPTTPWWEDHLPLTFGANGATITISEVDVDCTLPVNPPPPDCTQYTCFPLCLACYDNDIGQVNASLLFFDVTSLNGCCLDSTGSFDFDGTSYYSGKIGDPFLISCGYVEVWYECSGDTFRRRVKITDVNGGVSDTTQDDIGGCVDGEFEDTFSIASSLVTPLCFNFAPFYVDTISFFVYTNNSGTNGP